MTSGIVRSIRPQSVEDEAADWLTRLDRGDLTPDEATAFDAWLSNPENAATYFRGEELMRGFNLDDGSDSTLNALRAEAREAGRRPSINWALALTSAAAASILLALMVGGLLFLRQPGNQGLENGVAARPPAPAASASGQLASAPPADYETAIGQRRTVQLADGTKVTLDTGTRIVIAFDKDRRLVRLARGQALFEVAHNARWPFTVEAADRRVTALGTVFEVGNFPGKVHVLLVEGRVKVERATNAETEPGTRTIAPIVLRPGQSFTAELGVPQRVATVDVNRQLLWREGFVQFDDETLAQAVSQFNRYTPAPIRILDDRTANMRISGVFKTGDAHQFVTALQAVLPVEAQTDSGGNIALGSTSSN